MGVEIERKFLTASEDWRAAVDDGVSIRQGYLTRDPERAVRVRTKGASGYLTIKSKPVGHKRSEFEYEIPLTDAEELLDRLCVGAVIEKRRYKVAWSDGHVFEIDEFLNPHPGLVVIEVELQSEDESFERPPWLGREVSDDPRYLNQNIADAVLTESDFE